MNFRIRSPFAASLLFAGSAIAWAAEPPATIPFQGVLASINGTPLTDGAHTVSFRLYNVATGGAALWTEPAATVTTKHGIFSTILGSPTAFPSAVDFTEEYWVGVQVSGEAAEMTPRLPLASVPYAMGLTLPVVATAATGNASLKITNTGTGRAGYFENTNAASANDVLTAVSAGSGDAVRASTTGTARAGTFIISNPASTFAALYGNTDGSGKAVSGVNDGTGNGGYFQITNAANGSDAMLAITNGGGAAVRGNGTGLGSIGVEGDVSGLGFAGYFKVTNTSNPNNAVYGQTNGNGAAIYGTATGGGAALYGTATGGGDGVYGIASGAGSGVHGVATGTGAGVLADGNSGTSPALEVTGGTIKMAGAGVNTNTAAFIYRIAAGDISATGYDAYIDNAQCNNQPGAILFAINNNQADTNVEPDPISVGYSSGHGKWFIHNNALHNVSAGTEFNILVFRP